MGTFHRHNGFYTVQTVKTSLSLIYKLVSSWGPKNVPTRTRILDIAILVGTFCPHNVGFTRPHTHTHTHTVLFPCFMGTFHRHNGFYTVQTVKTSLSLIYKLVSSWGPKNVPTRTRILDIAILVGTFCPHNVGFTSPHTHTDR